MDDKDIKINTLRQTITTLKKYLSVAQIKIQEQGLELKHLRDGKFRQYADVRLTNQKRKIEELQKIIKEKDIIICNLKLTKGA